MRAVLVVAAGCGARTEPFDDEAFVDGSADVSEDPVDAGCACPDGQARVYGEGCDAEPTCVEIDAFCSAPSSEECTCATHQPISVSCRHHGGAGVPITGDQLCSPDPPTGFLVCDPIRGPIFTRDRGGQRCGDDQICGHIDGETSFTCCDPSIECGRCLE